MRSMRSRLHSALPLCAALLTGACATAGRAPAPEALRGVEHRVYDVAAGRFVPFADMVARAADADVVFFGEQHGNRGGHQLQLALLQGLAQHGAATLSLEMFERDVAHVVTAYAEGRAPLESLMAGARPWPRYATDYQPQVDFSRARQWPVIAANVPRSLANAVAREGVALLDTLDASTRAFAAEQIICPADAYRDRFVEEMRRHPVGETDEERAAIEQRYYESQCVKDETMAESIARALEEAAPTPVVHLTGAFHSDYGDGIPARLLRRRAGADVVLLTIVPVEDLRRADPAAHQRRADYLLFTRR